MTTRRNEIKSTFMKNLDYLAPRYLTLAEAAESGSDYAKFGDTFKQLLDRTREMSPEEMAAMLQCAVDAAVWTVEQFPVPETTPDTGVVAPMSPEVKDADSLIRSSADVTVHRFHPDADAGISQFLMVLAAVGTVKSGPSPVLDLEGEKGGLLVNGPGLVEQLKKVSWATVQRALRPIFNETLISAYAGLQTKHGIKAGDNRPEVEFLRHVRNASAHGNEFTFRDKEPRKPAVWKGKEVTRDLQGTVLLYKFMKPGDVAMLVDDVFQIVDPQC